MLYSAGPARPSLIFRPCQEEHSRLALSQAFVGTETQMMPALGALVVLQLTHSVLLTGLVLPWSRFLIMLHSS